MPVDPTILVVGGAVVLVAFAAAALSYMRAVNVLVSFIREKKEGLIRKGESVTWDRELYILPGAIHPTYLFFWISRVVLGTKRLDIADADYRALLRTARLVFQQYGFRRFEPFAPAFRSHIRT